MNPAARALEWAADAFYPRVCPGCGRLSDRPGRHLCWGCLSGIELFTESLCDVCGAFVSGHVRHRFVCGACRQSPPAYDRARSAGHFTGLLRDLVHRFKYSQALWLKNDLADLLEGCLRAHFDAAAVDVVLPVPLHPVRMRERSYNQAAVLAEALAGRIGRRFDGRSLVRVRQTGTQTRLRARERKENMRGAFCVRRPEWVRGRAALLIDDVMTTGATLDACARALKKAGARRVWALTAARGL